MELNLIFNFLAISVALSIATNFILRNLAKNYKFLIDLPDKSRKFHKRATPLTGGLAIIISILISGKLFIDLNNISGYLPPFTFNLAISSIVLVALFLYDDIKGLSALIRLFIQITLTLFMIISTDTHISSLGNIFGGNVFDLGIYGIPFTIFCAVGIMNAFNMIDGINGLCAGYAMSSLLFIGFFSGLIYDSMLVLIIGAMIGFLIFNLRFAGKKRAVFLGDHGSNMIGFWVAWLAIYSTQSPLYSVQPMTMVWFVAIPLLDCLGLIISRVRRGISWTTAGRDHIHHKLMIKFSPEGTLVIIIIVSFVLGLIGLMIEKLNLNSASLPLFMIFACLYYFFAYNYKHIKIRLGA